MAELADAHGSGPCESNFMEVQVLLSAPRRSKLYIACSDFFLQKIRVRSCRCSSLFAKGHVRIFSISSFNILGVSFLALVYLRTDVINIRSAYSVAKQKILNKTIYKKAKIVYNKLINIIKPNVKQKGEIKYVLYRNRFGRNKYCGRNRG